MSERNVRKRRAELIDRERERETTRMSIDIKNALNYKNRSMTMKRSIRAIYFLLSIEFSFSYRFESTIDAHKLREEKKKKQPIIMIIVGKVITFGFMCLLVVIASSIICFYPIDWKEKKSDRQAGRQTDSQA
jgi:hypothetical protein